MAGANPGLVACPSCDLLFDVGAMRHGEKARCTRCGQFLTAVRDDAFEKLQAYTASGLICLLIGCSFPFLSFKASGLESVMTLPQTVMALYQQGRPDMAFLVAGFIIGIPAAVMLLLLALSTCLVRGRYFGWMTSAAHLVFETQNWAMVEVFFIGVLVSLVKIGHMATVVLGISFWGYGAFALFFVMSLANLDRLQCWNRIERLAQAGAAGAR